MSMIDRWDSSVDFMTRSIEIPELSRSLASRRKFLRLSAAVVASLGALPLLAACGGEDDETPAGSEATSPPDVGPTATAPTDSPTQTPDEAGGEPRRGGTIVQAEVADADNLDPHRYYTTFSSNVINLVCERVIQLTPDLELEPILLDSIEVSEDALIYTMHVREGVKFHNGDTLDAEAIAFSHARADNELAAYPGQFYGATWEVVDPMTVNMIMPEPNSGVILILAFTGCGIVPPNAVAEMNDDMSQHPIGTGPFMFKEWVPGDHATLVAFDEYQNPRPWIENPGRPHVDEILIRVILEEQTQIAELETGGVHLILMPSQQVARFEGNDDAYLIRNEQSTTTAYLAPVTQEQADGTHDWIEPFNDQAVRQAVGWALNVDEIIEGVLGGLAVRNRSTLPTGNPGYSEKFQDMGFEYDPDRAKQLLDEAGWVASSGGVREKDGQRLSIVFWSQAGATFERIGQLVQNYLQQVGFEVVYQGIEQAIFVDRRLSGDCHLVYSTYNWNDPDIVWWLGGDTSLPSGHYVKINPEFDEIAQQGWLVTELDERGDFYYQASKIMVEDGAMIPLWNPVFVDGVRAELKDFKHGAQGRRFFNDAYLEG
ncbi:MAG TPA: ABC transporter substrate-binding protein [Thermomicrobiales bacterium]|nr:ABC transporter substrate-binding protein [Thermomicrobiales bacterium]